MNLFLVIMIVAVWSSVVIAEESAEQPTTDVALDLPPPPALDTVVPEHASTGEQSSSSSSSSSDVATEPAATPVPELPPLSAPPTVDAASPTQPAAPEASVHSVASEAVPAVSEPNAAAIIPIVQAPQQSTTPESDTLFSTAPAAATDVPDTVIFEKSEEEEHTARQALEAIEAIKEQKLEAYLAFDAELDEFFTQAGLARGTATADVASIKSAMVEAAEPGVGVNDGAQQALAGEAPLLEAVERDMKTLQECEAEVIKAVKALSDVVLSLGDVMLQIQSQRIEMTSSTDHAMIVGLSARIKEAAAKIAEARTSFTAASGVVKAVDDSLAKGRERVSAAKKNIDALVQKNIHIADALKGIRATIKIDESHADSAQDVSAMQGSGEHEIDSDDSKKKNRKSADSWVMNLVKNTVFEAPYCVISDTLATLWNASASVRHTVVDGAQAVYQGAVSLVNKDAVHQEGVIAAHEAPLADPVLERIRLERLQSKQRVAELSQQREIIEMKDTLLDRLEAERVMQLDTKQDIAAELSRAYARHDRELTWVGLFKRLVWKTYASTRRLATYVYNWIQGADIHRGTADEGRGIEKDDSI